MKFALNNSYPIDNAGQVKVAGLYFDKYLTKFSPADRVIIANNLEKQAEVLGVYLDYPWILNYGRMTKNASYSPDFEINMKMRKELCKSGHVMVKIGESVVDGASVVDKLLAAKESTSPQAMTGALDAFDKAANFATHYDQRVMDPVFTVYGSLNSPDYDSIPVGYDLTNRHLKKVACNENVIDKLASVMNESVVEDFRLHPFEAFVAMRPQEQRLVADLIKQACDGKMPEAASRAPGNVANEVAKKMQGISPVKQIAEGKTEQDAAAASSRPSEEIKQAAYSANPISRSQEASPRVKNMLANLTPAAAVPVSPVKAAVAASPISRKVGASTRVKGILGELSQRLKK